MKRNELKEFALNEKKLAFIEKTLNKAETALRTGDELEITTVDRDIIEYVVDITKALKVEMVGYISAIKVDYTKVNM